MRIASAIDCAWRKKRKYDNIANNTWLMSASILGAVVTAMGIISLEVTLFVSRRK